LTRDEVTFTSSGQQCAAWLYRPEGEGPFPSVILAHGFAGTREIRLDAYARRFTEAGLLCLVFDYRHFGDSEGEPRQLLDIKRQLADWRAAIGHIRSLPYADAKRTALWGTSFGGGHVLTLAAEDPNIATVVSQVPFVDGLAASRSASGGQFLRLSLAALRDEARRLTGRKPFLVPVVGLPGTVAAMTTPDAETGYRNLVPEGVDWRNEVAARIFLRVAAYRPVKAAGRIRCPVLFCIAEKDRIVPATATRAAAGKVPLGEIRSYPLEHFEIYYGEGFEKAVADQLAFLRRNLLKQNPFTPLL